ncbi:cysteine desulfurase family protein [Paenibacillus xylaniclasticus]|uniref:cysteine desulfurase family protein n=1 Tax=Paenibacillus xylaniclasticus TaxID=588083 RepID=UPI0013DFECD3|nr:MULTISPECIES: cysteine desulfurase family protein [Paenibacillus]GFN33272.1 cysteine desulfurase IscS [Paenibacillus curdlanolyticus]
MRSETYFDYNATSELDEQVRQAMIDSMSVYGNPSSRHSYGAAAKTIVSEARAAVARLMGCEPEAIKFTSGGSESNNWAIKGLLEANGARGEAHIITTEIEHPSVLQVCAYLERTGRSRVTYLPVNHCGAVSIEELQAAIRPDTKLITIMLANNEIGTIQPIREAALLARSRGILMHTDAVQAAGKLPLNVRQLGVDALSMSAHKFGGPKGVGALYVRPGVELEPLIHGGGQEFGLRSGTENVIGLAGFGKAAAMIDRAKLEAQLKRWSELKRMAVGRLQELVPDCRLNGSAEESEALPNTINFEIGGIRGESLAGYIGVKHGAAVSVGSACSATKQSMLSHVLRAIGRNEEQIRSAIRISLGPAVSEADIERLCCQIAEAALHLRTVAAVGSV